MRFFSMLYKVATFPSSVLLTLKHLSTMFRIVGLVSWISLVFAKTVTYDFSIGWVTVRLVSMVNGRASQRRQSSFRIGLRSRSIPTIVADVGDTVVVTAHNNLGNETTSLHFHGMFQKGSGIYDGATGVTACPIQPGDSYTYQFVANPAGTHWYHSHDKGIDQRNFMH
jgi:iron transport multicopper oxidase